MRGVLQHLLQRAGSYAKAVRAPALTRRRVAAFRTTALTGALLLMTSAVPGAAVDRSLAVPVPVPTVTPAEVSEALDPGGSLTVDKTVTTPSVPPKPDVVLMVDGTFSMDTTIVPLKENLKTITDEVREAQPDSRFGVVSYGDRTDGDRAFIVRQELTHDLAAVDRGVQALRSDLGLNSPGPAEDWINALWQTADGAGGRTVFREGASPIIVLVGDASSHDPSLGHSLTDAINALRGAGVRVLGVDIATVLGDGLNGNGDNGPDPGENDEPTHEPNQATKIVEATGGSLLQGVDPPEVVEKIVEGLTNLPTTVTHRTGECDPYLSVTLAPQSRTVTSGNPARFTETISVAKDAPQGTTLQCTVQFPLNGDVPEGNPDEPVPDYHEQISIDVNDVGKPQVIVDDRTVEATGEDGAEVELTVTATDEVDGELPVTCDPVSGSLFPVGRTTVVCAAADSAGNTGSDTAAVTVSPYPEPDPPDPPDEPEPPDPPDEPDQPEPPDEANLAVTASAAPARNYTGEKTEARFTLSNAGPDAAQNVVVTTRWPGAEKRSIADLSSCTRSRPCTIPAGGRRTVTQSAVYHAALTGEVSVSVDSSLPDPQQANNTDTARIRFLQPKLTVTPEVGKPGQVVHARGKDFPPRSTVRLTWKPGITAARSPVRVGADGTFEAQVLVLRKDRLGPRELRAKVAGLKQLKKKFLVVQRHLSPPDFTGRS
ncbi:DUF11 domain-containing protein [Streptomyces sp. N2-109]|uniref:DUF11 domain-containing protein n=1 Tax=Streptomyces gossypii TaxID=2883101 RepID=A0ABT2K166_9ACTN|nr:VWA domain-containing protein [Streptomyces gossypii]MCT2593908.1 DUF11 domain-containing protein [Streptomyces gossypii]